MKAKKQFTQIFLTIFFSTQCFLSLYPTEIPITQIKNLASVLKPEYEYLSPIHGAIFCHNNYIENLYRYGKEEDKTIKLTKKLFFVHHDNVTFDRTYLGTNIAAHFSPQDIGQIIAEIENFKNNLRSKITYSKKGKPMLPPKKIIIELSNAFKDKITTIIATIETTKKTEIKQSIISYLKTAIARKQEEVKTLTGDEKAKTDKKITELKQQEKKEKVSDEIALKDFKISKENFIRFLIQAIPEDGDKYIQHHTTYILLAFLWKKVATKNDFLDYFKALSNTLKLSETDAPAPSTPSIFTNADFLSTKSERFLNSTFTSEDYKKITNQPESEIVNTINNDFEALALSYLGFDLFENPLPKEIHMSTATYIDTNNQINYFPDCVETSLRNLLNAILYNSATKSFALERLKSLDVSTESKLYKFYEKYQTAAKIHTLEAHNDWANIVSSLPNISYGMNNNCNIRSAGGIKNMLTVLNHLIPITTPENPKPSFEGLKEKLKSINIRTNIYGQYIEETNNNLGTVTFEFFIENQQPFTIVGIFEFGDFQIVYPSQATINHAEKFNSSLSHSLLATKNPYLVTKIIIFLRNYDYPIARILEKTKEIKTENKYEYLILFTQDMRNPEKALNYTEYLINKDQILNELTKISIIKNLYNQIPKKTIIKTILSQKISYDTKKTILFQFLFEYLRKILPPIKSETTVEINYEKKDIIIEILKNEIPSFPQLTRSFENIYQWINDTLSTITVEDCNPEIIIEILKKEIPIDSQFTIFFENFYQWINKTLPTITDDFYKMKIIVEILEKKVSSLSQFAKFFIDLYRYIKETFPTITTPIVSFFGDLITNETIMKAILKHDIFIDHKLFSMLHQYIQKTLPTISDDQEKINIIKLILDKEIPDNSETAKLFTPLYQAIEELPLIPTNLQEQFNSQKTKLDAILVESEKTSIFRRESEKIPSINRLPIGRIRSN